MTGVAEAGETSCNESKADGEKNSPSEARRETS
jgi:hypothetical protein